MVCFGYIYIHPSTYKTVYRISAIISFDINEHSAYSALSLVFSTNVVCVKTQQKTCQYQKYNQLKNIIQWHVFISVPQHYNPYSGHFAWRYMDRTHGCHSGSEHLGEARTAHSMGVAWRASSPT